MVRNLIAKKLRVVLPSTLFFFLRKLYRRYFRRTNPSESLLGASKVLHFISLSQQENLVDMLGRGVASGKVNILYIPWLRGQTPALVSKLKELDIKKRLNFVPVINLDLVPSSKRIDLVKTRVKNYPDLFYKELKTMLELTSSFSPIFLFSQDWYVVQRIALLACKASMIKTILIPHEGVYFFKDKYYRSADGLATKPGTDVTLCWNGRQESIFRNRGVPKPRLIVSGSVLHSGGSLTYVDATRVFSICFVCQPMDMQVDKKQAVVSQNAAINLLIDLSEQLGFNLAIKLPLHDIVDVALIKKARKKKVSVYEYSEHRDNWFAKDCMVIAHNSTALLEGVLAGQLPVSLQTFDFESVLEGCDTLVISDLKELTEFIERAQVHHVESAWTDFCISSGMNSALEKAKSYFGEFKIESLYSTVDDLSKHRSIWERGGSDFSLVSVDLESSYFQNLSVLLGEKIVGISAAPKLTRYQTNLLFSWGAVTTQRKIELFKLSKEKGVYITYLEDHPLQIRKKFSDPATAIIMTRDYPYFDTRHSFMKRDVTEYGRIASLVKKVVDGRYTKYMFNGRSFNASVIDKDRDILFIDQRDGDASLLYGGVSHESLSKLIKFLNEKRDAGGAIYVKIHPDSQRGYDTVYTRISEEIGICNIIGSEYEIISVIDSFQNIAVLTSGVGFESIIRKKNVVVFGNPFYKRTESWPWSMESAFTFDSVIDHVFLGSARYCKNGRKCEPEDYFS